MKKLTVALVLFVGLGLVGASFQAEETPEVLMQAGLEALYTKGDAEAAAATFRKVLEVVIDHDDIMSAPGNGRVWRRYYEQLLDVWERRSR